MSTLNTTQTWAHNFYFSLEQWKELIGEWKNNNKHVQKDDLLMYSLVRSSNKEVFLEKAIKAFTPITNKNKLQNGALRYGSALEACIDLKKTMEKAKKLHSMNKSIDENVSSIKFGKVHGLYGKGINNIDFINESIAWIDFVYVHFYNL